MQFPKFSLFAFLMALPALGCTKQFVTQPVVAMDPDLRISLEGLRDGPNRYGYRSAYYRPAKYSRFIWATVQVSNTSAKKHEFDFASCGLDQGTLEKRPLIVGRDSALLAEVSRYEWIGAHRTIRRKLIFQYPERSWPTRLRCGKLQMPIPQP